MTENNVFLPTKMFIYPGPRVSVQGRGEHMMYKPDGTKVPTGKTFHIKAAKDYCFPVTSDGLKIDTGLEEHISNPFKNEEFLNKYVKDYWRNDKEWLKEQDYITKQTYLEVMHNRPKGTYTSERKTNKPFDVEAGENNYLEGFRLMLEAGTNVLVAGKPYDDLAMCLAKKSGRVADSKEEYNPSQHDFYIGQEHEAKIEKANKRSIQRKGIVALDNLQNKFGDFEKYQLGIVLRVVRGEQSAEGVREKLEDYVFNEDKNMEARINLFTSYVNMLNKKEGLEKLYVHYVFQQAINTDVINMVNGSFLWPSKKGKQNLYNLGTSEKAILNQLGVEMSKYDVNDSKENWYGDLIEELKGKGVKLVQ